MDTPGLGRHTFQRRAAKAFPGLDFNFIVPDLDEEEAEESVSKDEADPGVFSDTPSSAHLPVEAEVPAEAGSLLSPVGASSSNLHGSVVRTTETACNSTSNIYAPFSFLILADFKL